MAIDDWLLDQLVAGRREPVLRLYDWSVPTLSLGFHQRRIPHSWRRAGAEGRLALVRRPSGGRAVLHAGTLTYALLWPDAPRERSRAYRMASGWLVEALAPLAPPLGYGQAGPALERQSCFATSTPADLVEPGGAKRIGSAQLWRRGHLLQHGCLLLDPPEPLWRELFGAPPPALAPLQMALAELVPRLRRSAGRALGGGPLMHRPLAAWEWEAIDRRRHRFRLQP